MTRSEEEVLDLMAEEQKERTIADMEAEALEEYIAYEIGQMEFDNACWKA